MSRIKNSAERMARRAFPGTRLQSIQLPGITIALSLCALVLFANQTGWIGAAQCWQLCIRLSAACFPSLAKHLCESTTVNSEIRDAVTYLIVFGYSIGIAEIIYRWRGTSLLLSLRESKITINASARAAVVALVMNGAISLALFLLLRLPFPHTPSADDVETLTGTALMIAALTGVVMAPFAEELVFRGFLFQTLRSALCGPVSSSRWRWCVAEVVSNVLSSSIFAAMHHSKTGFWAVFVTGSVLAELYRRSGSLLPGILMHALANLCVGVYIKAIGF